MAVYYRCGTERRREASLVALRTVFELLGSSDSSHDTLALRVREDPASPIKSCSQEVDGKASVPPMSRGLEPAPVAKHKSLV